MSGVNVIEMSSNLRSEVSASNQNIGNFSCSDCVFYELFCSRLFAFFVEYTRELNKFVSQFRCLSETERNESMLSYIGYTQIVLVPL